MFKSFKNLDENHCLYLVPSNIEAMLTGSKLAKQFKNGTIELTYTNNTTETADCHDMEMSSETSWITIVSKVQCRARGAWSQ